MMFITIKLITQSHRYRLWRAMMCTSITGARRQQVNTNFTIISVILHLKTICGPYVSHHSYRCIRCICKCSVWWGCGCHMYDMDASMRNERWWVNVRKLPVQIVDIIVSSAFPLNSIANVVVCSHFPFVE